MKFNVKTFNPEKIIFDFVDLHNWKRDIMLFDDKNVGADIIRLSLTYNLT